MSSKPSHPRRMALQQPIPTQEDHIARSTMTSWRNARVREAHLLALTFFALYEGSCEPLGAGTPCMQSTWSSKAGVKAVVRLGAGLPVWQARADFVKMIHNHQTTILVGETGSGKTTQIAQFISEAGYTQTGKMVACTQPRR